MCVHVCVLFKRSVGASAPVWIFSTVEVLRFKLARSVDCKKRPSLDKASPANIGVLSWIYSILVESDQTFKLRQHGRNNQQRRKVVGGTTEEAVNWKKIYSASLKERIEKGYLVNFLVPFAMVPLLINSTFTVFPLPFLGANVGKKKSWAVNFVCDKDLNQEECALSRPGSEWKTWTRCWVRPVHLSRHEILWILDLRSAHAEAHFFLIYFPSDILDGNIHGNGLKIGQVSKPIS